MPVSYDDKQTTTNVENDRKIKKIEATVKKIKIKKKKNENENMLNWHQIGKK